jgi:hypothetical protein
MDLDEALDQLYASALDAFTTTRKALATELGPEGAQIKTLKKPNLAAWALNQLARRNAAELNELFETTDRVRHAQRRVLSGGKASVLREVTDMRGKIVNHLTKLAATILTEADHAAAASTLDAIRSSLVAVASDVEGVELLRTGRLTRELRAESVVPFTDVGAALALVEDEAADESEPADEAPDRAQAMAAARTAVNEARDLAQQARKAAREAEVEVGRRAREADEAERGAKSAREAAEFARRAAEAREVEAEEAAKALERAQADLKDLER